MKRLPILVAGALLVGSFVCSACSSSQAGQLTAENIKPLAERVTTDLEKYLDAKIAPDGSALSDARELKIRGGIEALRNAVKSGVEEPIGPLPSYEIETSFSAEESDD
ncbi:MAG: hypothetical protein AAGG01_10935 [Planctomycetota bacterium]